MSRRMLALCLLAACQSGTTTDTAEDTSEGTPTETDLPETPAVTAFDIANPIVPEVSLLPWPSDQYLAAADTRTGRSIQVPPGLLPDGVVPEMFAHDDGFSRVVPIVTFVADLDPASLPDASDWGATTSLSSPVLLVEADTWTLWPAMVEPDASTQEDGQVSLLIRPHRPLAPDTRYVVLLRDGLRTLGGGAPQRSEASTLLLNETEGGDRAVAAWREPFALVHEAVEALELSTDEIVQAWTFTTRSHDGVVSRTVAMQDQAGTADSSLYTVEAPTTEGLSCSPDCIGVYGEIEVPDFLDEDEHIRVDADGSPVAVGTRAYPFLVTIPKQITGPRPTVLFGHGFFSAIEEPTWGNLFRGLEQWDMPAITTKFLGFAEEDFLDSAAVLGGTFDRLDTVVAKQLQSHVAFTLVHRMVTEHLADELEVELDGGMVKPLDGDHVPYMGISNGGTQGLVLMATSPVLDRGGLVVPGGGWSHMLQRAAQFQTLGTVLSSRYFDARELQLAMSMLQQVFDPVDSLNYAEHLVTDRLPGRPANPELLLVEAVNDTQVSNLVSRWVGLAAGVPLLTPSVADVWGMETASAPAPDGAPGGLGFEIYDLGKDPLPKGNVAPDENGAHDEVRLRPDYREQMGIFLETGKVVRTCDGACTPLTK